jgi:hypothetical protein
LQSFSFGLVECTGAYFSNYTAWLMNPLQIKPSAQSVWPVVGQEILNADVGGNSGKTRVLPNLACEGVTTQQQLYSLWWISNVRVNVIRWMVPLP